MGVKNPYISDDKFDCMLLSVSHKASLAKWLSVRLRIKWLWVRVPLHDKFGLFFLVKNINVRICLKVSQTLVYHGFLSYVPTSNFLNYI